MLNIGSLLTQLFPPKPEFTENNIPDLHGKVYIVTGSNTGVGKEVAQILYSKNAKVYIAARSQEKAHGAIKSIRASAPASKGELVFLRLDLADLTTIKASADDFLSKEGELHVLFNNAGVMTPPNGSVTAQGYELQLGVNNIGTFMFTELLAPLLARTAESEPAGAVRVVWVSSSAAELGSHRPGGVPVGELDDYRHQKMWFLYKYGVSKAGNYLHSAEFARRYREAGVVSVSLNPGNLQSDLWRNQNLATRLFLHHTVLNPTVYGAYTELFAGLSPDVTMEKSGSWVAPWGRFVDLRPDLVAASKTEAEGGSGIGKKFWEWTEEQVKPYL